MAEHTYHRWVPEYWKDYALIDSGDGKRLEKLGELTLVRPYASALWGRRKGEKDWNRANARFEPTGKMKGNWIPSGSVPRDWPLHYKSDRLDLTFQLEMTKHKHVGIFPEQAVNWEWLAERLQPGDRFLNLFAYTGGASLAARAVGADVTHVDAIRQVVSWTRVNMELSGLEGIRWVVEDALKFVEREARRGKTYRGIMLDPPAWGLGPKGEKWQLESLLVTMLEGIRAILEPGGFIIMNTYSGLTPSTLETLWGRLMPSARMESGELCLRAEDGSLVTTGSLIRLDTSKND